MMPMAHNNVLRALGFLLMMSSISWAGAVRDSFPDNCDGLDSVACSELVREMRKKLQGNTPKSFGVYRDACKQGDSIGCVSLAGAVAVKETTDARKAEHIVSAEQIKNLNESCFKNDTESCLALAVAYYYGFGGRKEFEKSNELATKTCEMGDGRGCRVLGSSYQWGEGVEKSFVKANELFGKACEMGDGRGCSFLGLSYHEGEGVEKSFVKANELFGKACEMGHGGGCSGLGFNYAKGNGIAKSLERANDLYAKACEMGEGMGCNNLGLSFETGESVEKSFLKSKDLYTKACKTGEEEGCKNKWRLLSKTFSSPITYLALQERGTLFSSFLPTFGLYRFLLRVLYPELS